MPGKDEKRRVRVDEAVTIEVRRDEVTVTPEVFVVKRTFAGERERGRGDGKSPLRFVVKGLGPKDLLEVDFTSQGGFKGPFLLDEPQSARPVRGRYLFERSGAVPSGRIDRKNFPGPSAWKYEVVLRRKVGRRIVDVVAIDPMGVLR
jgi:hypothetical protein